MAKQAPSTAAVLSLVLALTAFGAARAASISEVKDALNAAIVKLPMVQGLAQRFISNLDELDISDKITILLSTDFYASKYQYALLSECQVPDSLELHILKGQFNGSQLYHLPVNGAVTTKLHGNRLLRTDRKSFACFRLERKAKGPRNPSEVSSCITFSNLYYSPNVVVHAIAGVFTPPAFKKGPYSTLNF